MAAQPLGFAWVAWTVPVLPVFINGVAAPLPGFQRTRLLGEAMGRFLNTLNSGCCPRLGRTLAPAAGAGAGESRRPSPRSPARRRKTAAAGRTRTAPAAGDQRRQAVYEDPHSLHPQPGLGQPLMSLLEQGRLAELDAIGNDELSTMAGKSIARN